MWQRACLYTGFPKKIQLEKISKFHVGRTKKFAKQKSSEIKNKVGASNFFLKKIILGVVLSKNVIITVKIYHYVSANNSLKNNRKKCYCILNESSWYLLSANNFSFKIS